MTTANDDRPQSPAQQREAADPHERNLPMPKVVFAVTLGVVLSMVAYILLSEPFGEAELGDRRTLSDLRPAMVPVGQATDGKQLFQVHCVACHQASGLGLPGVFPPLDGSEWVLGDERIVANILLYGITGSVSVLGKPYMGAMPPFGQLSDAELAAMASHVRTTWSNKAAPLDAALFAQERKANPRTAPFNGGDELKALITKTP